MQKRIKVVYATSLVNLQLEKNPTEKTNVVTSLAAEKTRLQHQLQLENLSCNPTCN
jgi:hypothetical protein